MVGVGLDPSRDLLLELLLCVAEEDGGGACFLLHVAEEDEGEA